MTKPQTDKHCPRDTFSISQPETIKTQYFKFGHNVKIHHVKKQTQER